MTLRPLLFALSLTLCGCSSMPPASAPSEIPQAPAALTSPCESPDELPEKVTADQLVEWTVEWIKTAACEHAKRLALMAAWPR